jgi:hypothetical protein
MGYMGGILFLESGITFDKKSNGFDVLRILKKNTKID